MPLKNIKRICSNTIFQREIDSLTPLPDYRKKALENLVDDLENIEKLSKRVLRTADMLFSDISPDKGTFKKGVKELERHEKKLNKTTRNLTLLQEYARDLLSRINTNPQSILDLPVLEAWEINLTLSKLVSAEDLLAHVIK